jgi:predicted dithiol-disulfide oxidoreductase (DUF899 family)
MSLPAAYQPIESYGVIGDMGTTALVYQFMDRGPDEYCPGCTHFTNNVVALATLADNGVSWATVSNMPLAQIQAYAARKGWTVPFVSSHGTSFAEECGAFDGFMLSVFFRDGAQVYRTYSTTARGVDRLLFVNNMLDLSSLWTPGGLGGLTAWLAATSHVRMRGLFGETGFRRLSNKGANVCLRAIDV